MSGKSTLRLKGAISKKRPQPSCPDEDTDAETERQIITFFDSVGRRLPSAAALQNTQDKESLAVETYKQWLPPMLKAWAAHVATQKGFSGANEYVYVVMEKLCNGAPSSDSTIGAVDRVMRFHLYDAKKTMGDEYEAEDIEATALSEILAVHYLSPDAAETKAKYFRMSKRAYWRKVDAAHRLVAEDVWHDKTSEIEKKR